MLAHIPAGAKIVAEPVEFEEWARDKPGSRRRRTTRTAGGCIRPCPRASHPAARSRPPYLHEVGLENYETTLHPALIDFYEREGFCWVITGSTESGRAFADPRAVPQAIAYYRALAAQGEVVYRASPYARGQGGGRESVPSASTGASTTTRSPTRGPGRR